MNADGAMLGAYNCIATTATNQSNALIGIIMLETICVASYAGIHLPRSTLRQHVAGDQRLKGLANAVE